MQTLELNVSGMTCGNCVKHVVKAIQSVHGVLDVDVQLDLGIAKVTGDFAQGFEPLISALEQAGYPSVLVDNR